MTRQAATTCAAAVAPALEARGLPRSLSISFLSFSFARGRRAERQHCDPFHPIDRNSCQSRVVLLRSSLSSCCWPAIIDLHDDIPLLLVIFFVFSKLNTSNRYITTTVPLASCQPTLLLLPSRTSPLRPAYCHAFSASTH
jgi:hypothetical protein